MRIVAAALLAFALSKSAATVCVIFSLPSTVSVKPLSRALLPGSATRPPIKATSPPSGTRLSMAVPPAAPAVSLFVPT